MRARRHKKYFVTNEVILGDVIFFYEPTAAADNQVSHVGVCVGRKQGVPQIAHACYEPSQKSSCGIEEVIVSRLTTDQAYVVMRYQNQKVSQEAARIAQSIAQLSSKEKQRYDKHRLTQMQQMLKTVSSVEEALEKCQQSYQDGDGFWRAFKFFIREEHPLRPDGRHGWVCHHFVTTVFQMADIKLKFPADYLTATPKGTWPSLRGKNQKACEQMKSIRDRPKKDDILVYKRMIGALKAVKDKPAVPLLWFVKEWATYSLLDLQKDSTVSLPIDSKNFCAPSVLLAYMLQSGGGQRGQVNSGKPTGWISKGVLATKEQMTRINVGVADSLSLRVGLRHQVQSGLNEQSDWVGSYASYSQKTDPFIHQQLGVAIQQCAQRLRRTEQLQRREQQLLQRQVRSAISEFLDRARRRSEEERPPKRLRVCHR